MILIIGREFAVSGLRSIAAASGYTIEASELGKTKMAVAGGGDFAGRSRASAGPRSTSSALIAMWAVMLFGIVSAADYFRKFWRKVDDQVKRGRRRELLRLERQKPRAAALAANAPRALVVPQRGRRRLALGPHILTLLCR